MMLSSPRRPIGKLRGRRETGELTAAASLATLPTAVSIRRSFRSNRENSGVTVRTPKHLTPDESASLIEVAVTALEATIPSPHLAKLMSVSYVVMTARGPIVTGEGLIRITESE